jgi:hypothetical protein
MICATTLNHIASIPELCEQGHNMLALQGRHGVSPTTPLRLSNPGVKHYSLTIKDKLWLVLHTQDWTPEYEGNVRQLRAWIADTVMSSAPTPTQLDACLRHDVGTAEHRLAVVDEMMRHEDGTVPHNIAKAYYWATLPVANSDSAVAATWNAALALVDNVDIECDVYWQIDNKLTQLFDTDGEDTE